MAKAMLAGFYAWDCNNSWNGSWSGQIPEKKITAQHTHVRLVSILTASELEE